MKALRPGSLSAAAFVCSIAVATFVQCGEGAANGTAPRVAAVSTPQDRASQDPAPKPSDALRLLVSGSMLGRLEPCGCASGQLGGLARRMQHIGEQRNYDVLLEGGDVVDTNTELDGLKYFTALQVLFGMAQRYDALGVGPKDLLLPRDEWLSFAATATVVASDLACSAPEWSAKPFVEKSVRDKTVRIASFTLAVPEAAKDKAPAIEVVPPADAWKKALEGAADTTLRVLMLHGTDTAARTLVPKLAPPPDLVVCMDSGYVEPSPAPTIVEGVPVVFAGIRGRVLLDVWLSRQDGTPRAVCELVPLPASKTIPGGGGDPDVKLVLDTHRNEVKEHKVLSRMVRQLPTPTGATYVGTGTCRGCHPTAAAAWDKTKHAGAWTTLEKAEADPKRYGWPVTHYPDCVSCHVVGYREQSGFVSYEETPDLAAVGCERCHGPGSEHATSNGQKRLGTHGGVQPSLLCTQCHDFEQSPNFLYGDKWKLIEHGREPKK